MNQIDLNSVRHTYTHTLTHICISWAQYIVDFLVLLLLEKCLEDIDVAPESPFGVFEIHD
jgi:hypothetical protein